MAGLFVLKIYFIILNTTGMRTEAVEQKKQREYAVNVNLRCWIDKQLIVDCLEGNGLFPADTEMEAVETLMGSLVCDSCEYIGEIMKERVMADWEVLSVESNNDEEIT